jgi:hypothetical protein
MLKKSQCLDELCRQTGLTPDRRNMKSGTGPAAGHKAETRAESENNNGTEARSSCAETCPKGETKSNEEERGMARSKQQPSLGGENQRRQDRSSVIG